MNLIAFLTKRARGIFIITRLTSNVTRHYGYEDDPPSECGTSSKYRYISRPFKKNSDA